ncbi:MAG: hypothetical protein QOF94_2763 [Acidobacteriaceae bacterium]|jgi:hypothetical protein
MGNFSFRIACLLSMAALALSVSACARAGSAGTLNRYPPRRRSRQTYRNSIFGGPMSHARAARYCTLLQIRAPEHFTAALDRAAESRVTTRSDYVRSAVLDRLRDPGDQNKRSFSQASEV